MDTKKPTKRKIRPTMQQLGYLSELLQTGNGRGALGPVSYTHLDVYKRQVTTELSPDVSGCKESANFQVLSGLDRKGIQITRI